jgi:iron complex outermembrane receptor protein
MEIKPYLTPAAACALMIAVGPARAQPAAQNPIEEIIVTATRIEKALDRVPAAISVIGQEDIQLGRQQLALDESLSRVPGVYMQNRFNFAQDLRVSIRGFGARANFGIRGIKILVDGIPETLPDGQGSVDSIDLGATSQIEVLRGPSSSLWGNASGGVISITSELAPAEPFSEVRVTAGEDAYQKLQFKAGGGGDRMGYLVSLSDSSYDGYREQSRSENTQLTGRFNFDLGGDREFLTVLSYTDQPISDDAGALNLAELAADRRAARDVNATFDAGESLEQSRIGFVYNMPIGEKHQLSARNYYAWRDFGNKLPFPAGGIVELDRFFAGGGINYIYDGTLAGRPNQVIIGLDVDHQDDDRQRFNNSPGGIAGALTFEQNETVRSRGLFAQNDLTLSENVELSFGVRADSVEFDVTDRFLSDGDDSGNVKLDDVSPMVGIIVGLTENVSVYGTYSSAFETPTTTEFNRPDGTGGFNPSLEPQVATNFEIGLRGSIAEKHFYEVAVFNIEVDDELIPFEVPLSPGRVFFQNAGRSNRDGIEFSLRANPTDRLRATLSYTYSDFEFDEFIDANLNDFAGNTIPGIGEHVLFAEIAYRHERGWYAALDLLHSGDQYADNANAVLEDGYALGNLRMGFEKELDSMTISPFLGINNLFDETYNANIRINAFGGRYYEAAPGRNAYAGISVLFRHR